MLKAGYLEDWVWNATLSGVPQGGVVSPVMSNIYLHRLDEFVETVLVPEYTRGRFRRQNTDYTRVQGAIQRARKRGDRATARQLRKQLRGMPDPRDPGFRRLRYTRYADLCRARHKSAYADHWIMPTMVLEVLVNNGESCRVLGIILACDSVISPSGWVSGPLQTGEDHEHRWICSPGGDWSVGAVRGGVSRRAGACGLCGAVDTRRCPSDDLLERVA